MIRFISELSVKQQQARREIWVLFLYLKLAVSYTHLDVYKRQVFEYRLCASGAIQFGSNIGMPFCFCHAFQIIIHDNSLAEKMCIRDR